MVPLLPMTVSCSSTIGEAGVDALTIVMSWSLLFVIVPNAADIPSFAALTHGSVIVSAEIDSLAATVSDAAVVVPSWPQPVTNNAATAKMDSAE